MDSLIAIEQAFQQLLRHLGSQGSHRIAVTELVLFVKKVYHRRRPAVFRSYFQQLFPLLSDHFEDDSVKFRSPEFYELLLAYLEQVEKAEALGDYQDRFQAMVQQCRLHQTLGLIWLGEWYEALGLWQLEWLKTNAKSLRGLPETHAAGDSPQAFEKWLERLKALHFPMPDLLAKLSYLWRQLMGPDFPETVWVPLIEKNTYDAYDSHAAMLEAMGLEVNSTPGVYHRDFLTFNYNIDSSNDLMHHQAFDALYSMKNLLQHRFAAWNKIENSFRYHFTFANSEYRYTGDSLGVAMALLHLCRMTQYGQYRRIFRLKSAVAATGIVNSRGEIQPISRESLAAKLKVFYYSPLRYFLLPEKNLNEAKQILDPLRRAFPGRKLVLVPLKSVEDLLDLEQVLESSDRSVSIQQRYQRYFQFFWPLLAIFLAILLGLTLFVNTDRNMVSVKGNGHFLLAYNQKGKLLWNEEFPVSMEFINEKIPEYKINSYAIGDMNGDGFNEICFTIDKHKIKESGIRTVTYLLNHKGKTLWTYSGFSQERYGKVLHSDAYIGRFHIFHDFDKDGQNELFCFYHNDPYFPAQLIQFDLSGQVRNIFYNSGYFNTYEIFDLDSDGIEELIMGGTNNDYDTAILAVFKYPHYSGHSPQLDSNYVIVREDADYRPPYVYLRFPKVPGLPGQFREHCHFIHFFDKEIKTVTINLAGDDSLVRVYLGENFNVLKIVPYDRFFGFYQNRYSSFDWENFDLDSHLEKVAQLEFWDGRRFTKTYSVNSR